MNPIIKHITYLPFVVFAHSQNRVQGGLVLLGYHGSNLYIIWISCACLLSHKQKVTPNDQQGFLVMLQGLRYR